MAVIERVVELVKTFNAKKDKKLVNWLADELAAIVVAANPTVNSFLKLLSHFNGYIGFPEPVPTTFIHIGYTVEDIVVHKEQLNIIAIQCSGPDGCKSRIELVHEPVKRPKDVCFWVEDKLTAIHYDKNLTMCRKRKGARNVLQKHINDIFFFVECEALNYFALVDFIARNIDAIERAVERGIEITKKNIKDIIGALHL